MKKTSAIFTSLVTVVVSLVVGLSPANAGDTNFVATSGIPGIIRAAAPAGQQFEPAICLKGTGSYMGPDILKSSWEFKDTSYLLVMFFDGISSNATFIRLQVCHHGGSGGWDTQMEWSANSTNSSSSFHNISSWMELSRELRGNYQRVSSHSTMWAYSKPAEYMGRMGQQYVFRTAVGLVSIDSPRWLGAEPLLGQKIYIGCDGDKDPNRAIYFTIERNASGIPLAPLYILESISEKKEKLAEAK